ncbi:hypothetical protein JSE7799_02166 [Jannaschia seosinensis]|uniref:Uncharacterized protein n=1 Tax=Jannaschia seosinensis TaxID=313367 RepID=A0A0M7B4L6_9RHOB|nr:hypothetical protein JSE7799_00452 [Jannaschia seosinensis]CUH39439.1 hypothetical protein JSE7799_02166 [Jannaschia seosinensis]
MAKSTVVPFELPSEFSADPLTEVIQAGAKELRKRRLGPIGFSLAVGIARRIRLPLSPLCALRVSSLRTPG